MESKKLSLPPSERRSILIFNFFIISTLIILHQLCQLWGIIEDFHPLKQHFTVNFASFSRFNILVRRFALVLVLLTSSCKVKEEAVVVQQPLTQTR